MKTIYVFTFWVLSWVLTVPYPLEINHKDPQQDRMYNEWVSNFSVQKREVSRKIYTTEPRIRNLIINHYTGVNLHELYCDSLSLDSISYDVAPEMYRHIIDSLNARGNSIIWVENPVKNPRKE